MSDNAPLHPDRYHAFLQLLRTADSVWNASREFFAPWQIGPSQFNVLNLLRGAAEGLSQTELSQELIMHRSNITGLVDRLEKRGLVERKEDASDRRAYRVVLTDSGKVVMDEILPLYYAGAEQLWGELENTRLHQLTGDLREAARNAERIARQHKPQAKQSNENHSRKPPTQVRCEQRRGRSGRNHKPE